jgi:apoptosis-inducing factor 2
MKKVVVIGGGFCGSLVAKELEKDFDLTLIDAKDYFEFTPSVLRTIVDPEHLNKIQVKHSDYLKKAKVIIGCVEKIEGEYVYLKNEKIRFDYLVVASGSSYSFPIKEKNLVIASRGLNLKKCHESLKKSKDVLIIGGGLVGLELVAEIREFFPNKKIKMVHSSEELIGRQNKKTIDYAHNFLEKSNIEVLFNEKVIKSSKGVYETNKNRKIKTDMAFLCTGIKTNSDFLKNNFADKLNNKKQLMVNNFLQVSERKNIFAGGDVTSTNEEKTAQNAEKHAKKIIQNIRNLEKGKKLKRYEPKKRMMVISLGKNDGILSYGNFMIGGFIPAMFKRFIEWKSMEKYKNGIK